ncbi:DegV family protein [bacterium]|nr:DegV family protein [bacterium]
MDSTCGMTTEDFEKADIIMAPLYIRQGDTLYRDGVDIKPAEFYRKEREGVIFESVQTNPDDLVRIFQPIINAGDEVVCVMISGAISGSVNAAHVAVQTLGAEDRISIVDSRQSGYGQLAMGRLAKKMADEGKDRTEIVAALTDLRERTWVYFIMESLHWLYKGGRLTGAEAFIGTIIQLKPVVWFDDIGRMVTHDKIRTIKAGKERLKELVLEMASYGVESAGLHWADNWDEAKEFGDWMESVLHVPVEYNRVSCVIGCHVGPTVLGPVVVMKEKPRAKTHAG